MLNTHTFQTDPSKSQLPFDNVSYVESFSYSYNLKESEIVDLNKIGVYDIMLCDSLMLIASQNNDGYLSCMNLRTGDISQDFIKQGNGPGELIYTPYFSVVNITEHNGETICILPNNKGKLLRFTPKEAFGNNYPDIETLPDSVKVGLFYSIYVNDSTYLCREVKADCSGQIRYLQVSGEKRMTTSMEKLNRLAIPVKGDGYMFNILSSLSRYKVSEDRVIEASIMLNTIHMYSLDGSFEKTICYGKNVDNIDHIYHEGMAGLKSTFTRLNIYDDFFAVMYGGGKMEKDFQSQQIMPKILIFDWNGNPMSEISLPDYATVFDIDLNACVLYTFDREREVLRKYDVSGILKTIRKENGSKHFENRVCI